MKLAITAADATAIECLRTLTRILVLVVVVILVLYGDVSPRDLIGLVEAGR